MTQYNTHTLENGLRVIHRPMKSPVIYCGFEIAAGSRHELPGEEGLAHFCEHMTFKGTRHRRAWHILNCLESVGGDLNAFTNKETTVFYAAVLREHLARAVDLLCDIVFCSTYPQHEIDKEIAVVCDEIESYNDSPAELIYDEFENLLFAGHPLGHNVLGQASQLRNYTTADAMRFTARHYRPENMVFFVDGDIDFKRLIGMLQLNTESINNKDRIDTLETVATSEPPSTTILEHHTHQTHVMVGCRAYSHQHPQRMALYLLNNMLGGPGMNARLNLTLREHYGLVYTVESTMACYSDTGQWSIYFGCDPHDTHRCLQLVRHELDRFMEQPLSARQLSAAKKQLKGQLAVACENREQFALDFGKSFLTRGWERNIETLFARIDAVTADEIQQVACELFPADHLSTLIIR